MVFGHKLNSLVYIWDHCEIECIKHIGFMFESEEYQMILNELKSSLNSNTTMLGLAC